MALSMNFFDAADRSASTQYEIIALFSSSMFSSIQSSSQQIFDIDGRPFHPVNHHEIVGDVLEPTDPEWDDTLALEPIPVSDYMFSHEGMDGTGMDSSSSHRYTHATDGECSDSSSASSGLFHGVAIGDDADSPSTSFSNNFQTASITGPAAEKQHWQHENLHRQVTDTFTTSSEDDQSLPVVVAGQDNRFKPFHEEKWNQRYKELLVFYAQHGHVAVPHTYPPNQQLARWIKRQRRQYKLLEEGKQTTLTPERLEILDNVGFIWDSHEVNWREKYQMLVEYKEANGDCNVPSNHKDKKLATWVKCQRRQHKLYIDKRSSSMTPDRIADLDKIGFNWEIRHVVTKKVVAASEEGAKYLESSNAAVTLQNVPERHVRIVPPSA